MFNGMLPMALPSTPVGLKPDLQVVLVVYFWNRHLVLRPGAAHGSLPRQCGAGETIVVTDHAMLQTG